MSVQDIYGRAPLSTIFIDKAARQRQGEIEVDDLLDSIRARGVMSPILLTREGVPPGYDYKLIFGERRLTASLALGLPDIPFRLAEALSPVELQIIELEENIKRKGLPWRDDCKAVCKIHALYSEVDAGWTQEKTAQAIGVTKGLISVYMRVHRDLDNPLIAEAPTLQAAYNIFTRKDERKAQDAISQILEAGAKFTISAKGVELSPSTPIEGMEAQAQASVSETLARIMSPPQAAPTSANVDDSILNKSFVEWAPQYSGPKFNFIHCDFPYGINYNAGPLGAGAMHSGSKYDDSPEIYWQLVHVLATNLDKLMSHSGHLMFWLANDVEIQHETIKVFNVFAPSLVFWPKPLVWLKSDNAGIIADKMRLPRNIYETALVASREDKTIVKSTSNAYAAPKGDGAKLHPSVKPEPVLRYFFQMFVDETTRMLDPTCGGGSSLRAAESLGATRVLGLEIDSEHFANAKSGLRQFRVMRGLTK